MLLSKSRCICNQCTRNYNSLRRKVQAQLPHEKIAPVTAKLGKPQLDAWRSLLRGQALVLEQVERDFSAAGLPPLGWYDVLTELDKAPGGRLRIHELADAVILSRSGLSRLLDRIESAGLLRREPCKDDRRGAFATITPAGRKTLDQMWPVYERCLAEHFGPQLGQDDARTLTAALEAVARSVRG
jgi:DNA-binding MarR family transcriptional regulator